MYICSLSHEPRQVVEHVCHVFFPPLFASCVSLPVPLVTHRSAEERRLGNRALGEGMHSQRAANGESLSGG